MKLWKSAVNGVVPATARSTWASPSTSRRTVIPCALRSASSMPASCGSCRTGPGTNTTGATDLAELEWHVRVRVERVGEGDPVVAVRDIPCRYENRRKLLAGQHLLQVFQHPRVRQRQRLAAGGPQDVIGTAGDDLELLQLLRHLLCLALPQADTEVAGSSGIVVLGHLPLPLQISNGFRSSH